MFRSLPERFRAKPTALEPHWNRPVRTIRPGGMGADYNSFGNNGMKLMIDRNLIVFQ